MFDINCNVNGMCVPREWFLDIEGNDPSIFEYLWMTWTMWHIVFNAHMWIQFIWSYFTAKVVRLLTNEEALSFIILAISTLQLEQIAECTQYKIQYFICLFTFYIVQLKTRSNTCINLKSLIVIILNKLNLV